MLVARKKSLDAERVRFYELGHWRFELHAKWFFSNSRGNAIVWWIVQVSTFDENEVEYVNDADPIFLLVVSHWSIHWYQLENKYWQIEITKERTQSQSLAHVRWLQLEHIRDVFITSDDGNWFCSNGSSINNEQEFTHFDVNCGLRNDRRVDPNEFFHILCCFDDWISCIRSCFANSWELHTLLILKFYLSADKAIYTYITLFAEIILKHVKCVRRASSNSYAVRDLDFRGTLHTNCSGIQVEIIKS